MKSRSNARRKTAEPGESSTARSSNASPILSSWSVREQRRSEHTGNSPLAVSATLPPSVDQTGCFDKASLARYLGLSVRTLNRIAARGDLPPPDLVVGRSALDQADHRSLAANPAAAPRPGRAVMTIDDIKAMTQEQIMALSPEESRAAMKLWVQYQRRQAANGQHKKKGRGRAKATLDLRARKSISVTNEVGVELYHQAQ